MKNLLFELLWGSVVTGFLGMVLSYFVILDAHERKILRDGLKEWWNEKRKH